MKGKGGGWTGPAFTFTAEAEQEIRRAFGSRFPEVERAAFIRRMAGALAKLAGDKGEQATDPRMARDRAEKVAALLAEAASEIGKMTDAEKDVFDMATSNSPVALTNLAETLEKTATGFRKAADGHALGRGERVGWVGCKGAVRRLTSRCDMAGDVRARTVRRSSFTLHGSAGQVAGCAGRREST